MNELIKKQEYIYKAKIIKNSASLNSEGYIDVIINNKKITGWVREAGDLFRIGRTYETYLLFYPDKIKFRVKKGKRETIFQRSKPGEFTFKGTLENIFFLRPYSNHLLTVKCGINCGKRIIIITKVKSNINLKPGIYVEGKGGLHLDFLSINPCE